MAQFAWGRNHDDGNVWKVAVNRIQGALDPWAG
jgi:hypothetical protein